MARRSTAGLNYKVKNVDDDGNCFFRALFGAAKDTPGNLEKLTTCFLNKPAAAYEAGGARAESRFIHDMRYKFAAYIQGDVGADGIVTRTWGTLRSLDPETYTFYMEAQPEWMGETFPVAPETPAAFRRALVEHVKADKTWVGQIEVEIFKAILAGCGLGLDLRIYNSLPAEVDLDQLNLYNKKEVHYQHFARKVTGMKKGVASVSGTKGVATVASPETSPRAAATATSPKTRSPRAKSPEEAVGVGVGRVTRSRVKKATETADTVAESVGRLRL